MDRKTTTVEDVATLAGVSRGTVDRVLHNRPGVSAKNLIRVRKAIEELGYETNVYASSLASKKERVIALLMPDYNKGEYWEKMYQGFSEACKKNVNLKIRGVHYNYDSNDPESFQRACDAILEDEPNGVVLSPFFLDDMLLFTKSLSVKKIPYVYIDSKLDEPNYMAYFGVPMYRSGYLCAMLLTVGQKDEDVKEIVIVRIFKDSERRADPTLQRRMGFYEYMNEHYPKCNITNLFIDPRDKNSIMDTLTDYFKEHTGVKHIVMFNSRLYLIDDYLKSHPDPERRVIGFDSLESNIKMLDQKRVTILIAQHIESQSQKAVNALIQHILYGKTPEKKDNHMHMDILTCLNIEDY